MNSKNYIYYLVVMLIFMALKAVYPRADHDLLLFILQPTNMLVEFFTGSFSVYNSTQGYYYPDLNITIEKSCCGFNFWMLSFALSVFVSLNYLQGKKSKTFVIPGMFILSYVLTVFVNTSRILSSLAANTMTSAWYEHPITWLHQAEGAFIYLLFLILFYSSLQFFYSKNFICHEKLTQS